MVAHLRSALVLLLGLTFLTGVVYPLAVTAIGTAFFDRAARGSIVHTDHAVGSILLGQPFEDPKYFWGRLSATAPNPYNASASAGSNLGPTNPARATSARARIDALRTADPTNHARVPVDLVTSSGSGLDPHISPAAANYQLLRVARARGIAPERVRALVASNTEAPDFGLLGESRVNVLALNLALDGLR